MPFDKTKLPKVAPKEGAIDKTLRLLETPLIHDIPGGKEAMDKLAAGNHSVLGAQLRGFGVGALEGLTKPTTLAQIATLPLMAGEVPLEAAASGVLKRALIPKILGTTRSAPISALAKLSPTGRVIPAAITAGNALMTTQAGAQTAKDFQDPNTSNLKKALDVLNTTLAGVGTVAGGVSTARGLSHAAEEATNTAKTSKQALADALTAWRDARAGQAPLDPHDIQEMINGNPQWTALQNEFKRNPGGDIAKEVFPPQGGKKVGVPEPLSIEENNARLQKKAATDVNASADFDKGRKDVVNQLDKDLYKATAADAANQKPLVKAEDALGKAQGTAMDKNRAMDKKTAAQDLKQTVNNENAKDKYLENLRKTRAKAALTEQKSKDTLVRAADAAMKEDLVRTNAKAQQEQIDLAKKGLDEQQPIIAEKSTGVGPNGEPQTLTKKWTPPQEGGDEDLSIPDESIEFHDLGKARARADAVNESAGRQVVDLKDNGLKGPARRVRFVPHDESAIAESSTGVGAKPVDSPFDEETTISPEIRKELERMNEEMQTSNYTPKTFTETPRGSAGPGNADKYDIVAGSGGAPVYGDITSRGGSGTRGNVTAHIQNLLNGKFNKNGFTKTQQAALEVAEARANGSWKDQGFSAPLLPHAGESFDLGDVSPEASTFPLGRGPEPDVTAPEVPVTPSIEATAALPVAPSQELSGDIPQELSDAIDTQATASAAEGHPEAPQLPAGARGSRAKPSWAKGLRVGKAPVVEAPLTPEQFAALSPEEQAAAIAKERQALDTPVITDPKQRGAADTMMMARLAGAGLGGTIGAKQDEDHPVLGGVLGAGLGAAVPDLTLAGLRGVSQFAPEIPNVGGRILSGVNRFKNSAILGPYAVAKKASADMQALGLGALQKPDRAGDILKEFTTLEGLGRSATRFKEGMTQPYLENQTGLDNFVTSGKNPLSWSGKLMGGLTGVTKGALGQGGYTVPEQEALTMTENLTKDLPILKHPVVKHIFPFMNMAMNRAKRGFEYSPLTFLNHENWTPGKLPDALTKSSIGSLSGSIASQVTPEDWVKENPLKASLFSAGPPGLMTLMGMAAGSARQKHDDSEPGQQLFDNIGAGGEEASRELPGVLMLANLIKGDPRAIGRNYFSSYTNGLKPVADLINPEEAQTTGKDLSLSESLFNRMLSNIPGVRGTLPQTGRESRSPFSGLFSPEGINP